MSVSEDYEERIEEHRERKDEFFEESPRSPIPEDERDEFGGLDYFPPDPDYRFAVELDEHDEKETITVETTTGGEREYHRWGEFAVQIDGKEVTLQAYKSDPNEDRFWVPFRDETNGGETYPGGRYLDVEPEDRTDDGEWILDFNLAYNPYCAYDEAYECPLVPTANWLDVRVEAGEIAHE